MITNSLMELVEGNTLENLGNVLRKLPELLSGVHEALSAEGHLYECMAVESEGMTSCLPACASLRSVMEEFLGPDWERFNPFRVRLLRARIAPHCYEEEINTLLAPDVAKHGFFLDALEVAPVNELRYFADHLLRFHEYDIPITAVSLTWIRNHCLRVCSCHLQTEPCEVERIKGYFSEDEEIETIRQLTRELPTPKE